MAMKEKPSSKVASKGAIAFAIARDRRSSDAEGAFEVPKGHELIAAIPFPKELKLQKNAGGIIVSVDRKRLWKQPAVGLGVHRVVGVSLVGADAIDTPLASGPEGEPVPLKLVRFTDVESPPAGPARDRHRGSKVGGYPFHFNDPASSVCTRCKTPVVWAAHLAPQIFDETFGDSGSLYIYVCPNGCEAQSCIDLA